MELVALFEGRVLEPERGRPERSADVGFSGWSRANGTIKVRSVH